MTKVYTVGDKALLRTWCGETVFGAATTLKPPSGFCRSYVGIRMVDGFETAVDRCRQLEWRHCHTGEQMPSYFHMPQQKMINVFDYDQDQCDLASVAREFETTTAINVVRAATLASMKSLGSFANSLDLAFFGVTGIAFAPANAAVKAREVVAAAHLLLSKIIIVSGEDRFPFDYKDDMSSLTIGDLKQNFNATVGAPRITGRLVVVDSRGVSRIEVTDDCRIQDMIQQFAVKGALWLKDYRDLSPVLRGGPVPQDWHAFNRDRAQNKISPRDLQALIDADVLGFIFREGQEWDEVAGSLARVSGLSFEGKQRVIQGMFYLQ